MPNSNQDAELLTRELGNTIFLTWNPPVKPVKVGNITVTEFNGLRVTNTSNTHNGYANYPTMKIEYEQLDEGELSNWVLFHTFITDNPWTIPSYMQTMEGAVNFYDSPMGQTRDYSDFINIAYRTEREKVKLTEKISYEELFERFRPITKKQVGMVKNLLLKLTPGQHWAHGEMADYSYWRMVIDYSIVDAIIGQQPFCENTTDCAVCHDEKLKHYPKPAKEFAYARMLEIIDDADKAEQYMKVIWTVRQSIRHKTTHGSAYPYERGYSELQNGDNEFDIDTVLKTFEKDTHALAALEDNMHQVTRILLLDDVLKTKVFPDIKSYMVRLGGMNWADFEKLYKAAESKTNS